jgi:hypothetical protein
VIAEEAAENTEESVNTEITKDHREHRGRLHVQS